MYSQEKSLLSDHIIELCFDCYDTGISSYIDNNIEYIVADWTNRNEEILNVLNKYGRSGVPLYVYWKPGMAESKLLPAILTEQIVLDSL